MGTLADILNDELERYPGVKADQDYAIRKVTENFLSGNIKSGMSAEAISEVMKKPVDNVTKVSIEAAAEDVQVKPAAKWQGRNTQTDVENRYSYEALTSKPDIKIKTIAKVSDAEIAKYKNNTSLFGKDMREIASKANNKKNTPTSTYLYCKDLNADVLVTKDSFNHGAARMDAAYIAVCKSIAEVLDSSLAVNELNEREGTNGGYVLLGLTENQDSYVIVRSLINKKTWKLEEYEELYAIKKKSIKKEDVGLKPPHYIQKNGYGTSSAISIADFLRIVNTQKLANSVLSLDVVEKLGTNRGFDENITPNLLFRA